VNFQGTCASNSMVSKVACFRRFWAESLLPG
jgi:hypothetical protein